MKKTLIFLLTLCTLLAVCVFGVSADDIETDETRANGLYFLGLIQGYSANGQDFGLGDALTRAQAVVLLERYLGVLNAAETAAIKAPFDDVPAWADAYVGYACENKLVSGKTDASGKAYFDPDAPVSEAEFLTLLLRAMEYADKNDGSGDFVWSDPYALSDSLSLTAGKAEAFLRGDAFRICWSALGARIKTGGTMAEKLMTAGIFDGSRYDLAKRIASGKKIRVVCVGDSITQGTGAKNQSNNYPSRLQKLLGSSFSVINCGKASSYVMSPESSYNVKASQPALYYPNTAVYKTAISASPDVVILALGTNDARSMTDPAALDQWIKDYKALIADFAALDSKPQIYLSVCLPAVNAALTYEGTVRILPDLIRQVGEELDLPVLETGADLREYYKAVLPLNDKVHPDDTTYEALAVYMYNHVFGGSAEMPSVPAAKDGVVFVSDSGRAAAGGTSPADAVNNLAYAFGMLKENGGTIVVCGPVTNSQTMFPAADGTITITSVYDGVDYAQTANAKVVVKGGYLFFSDVVFENVTIHAAANGQGFYMGYNDLTIGDGVKTTWDSGITSVLSLNMGHTPQTSATEASYFDCVKDCTLTVNSGTFSIVRGGNRRGNAAYAVGKVAEGAKISVIINGGEFNFVSTTSVNSGTGMNDLCGELYVEINGGSFAGDFCAIANIGTNNTAYTPAYTGSATVKITGGTFAGKIKAYQSDTTKKLAGGVKLILTDDTKALASKASGFEIEYAK